MTRVGIYNRFWQSMGGGERHSAMVAQVLARSGTEVDLVGHTDVDLVEVASRLALDLSGTTLRVIPDHGDHSVAAVSAEYDLWVTASYMSRLRPRARRSAYLCWFPTPLDFNWPRGRRVVNRHLGPYVRRPAGKRPWRRTDGWFPAEFDGRTHWTWTSGDAGLEVAPGEELVLEATLGRHGFPATDLVVSGEDGLEIQRIRVRPDWEPAEIVVPASAEASTLRLTSETFAPGAGDPRTLGVAVRGLRAAGRVTLLERAGARYPWLTEDPSELTFLEGYDVVLANSTYTQDWISRLWGTKSEILYPPIQTDRFEPAAERAPVIVSVGRFFAPEAGHCKRQLDMVRTFRRLVDGGQVPGWRLVLIGGCEDVHRSYLDEVRAAAEGLPVDIHANAPRSVVEETLSRASVFWSATGLGQDEDRRPWANEHFGMATAEAMAAGCVPVVIDRSGQREIVRDGVDGFRWRDAREWRSRTRQVIADPDLRARLAAEAVGRAATFSDQAFEKRWRELAAAHRLLGED